MTRQVRQSWRALHDEVINFLTRDDNSRLMPGKRDAAKSGNAKQQIRVLSDYVCNLYIKYKSENVDKRHVSLSAFQRIRRSQPHLKLVQFAARNTSLCQKHQNFALKLKALKELGHVTNNNPDEFIKLNDDAAVKAMTEKLAKETEVQFDEWKRVSTDQGKKQTKLKTVVLKGEEFSECFLTETIEFRQHVERVKAQYEAIRNCKEKLGEDECLIQMDFAENYVCVPLEEVQSGYWNQEGVTLHPMVMYYRDEGGSLKHHSFVAVSDDKGHNASTILAIIKDLIPRVKKVIPDVKRIHYWTDSPTAQYRNKTIFSLVSDHHKLFGVFASWNYFEAGHSKGPCDGIGGTVKRLADDAVKRQSAVIQDANDFYAWASQEREDNDITYCFVSKDECALASKEISQKWSSVKSVVGTMKLHAVVGVADHKILTRELSCYCDNCVHSHLDATSSMCDGWVKHDLALERCSTAKKSVNKQTDGTVPMSADQSVKPVYQAEDWVAARYDEDWYVGQVVEADDEDVHINFMATGSGKVKENTFKWPVREDKIWVARDQVLCHIEAPRRLSKRLFCISSQQATAIERENMVFEAKRLSKLNM
ncbi:uncharacterized protein [Diadema antillarum]|uniref:uncharacterized protein n=1 Tax=Diadema antillarum TaxID=105358 RepID=UPI003A84AA8D